MPSSTEIAAVHAFNAITATDGSGIALLSAANVTGSHTLPDGVLSTNVPLMTAGKLSASVLPAIAVTDTFVVNTQAAMLALSAETGDVAVRTDLNKSFILKGASPGVLANWQELLTPTDLVQSVNGLTGTVTLTTANVTENTNLYYTTARVNADAPNVTLGTANGLSLVGQQLSLAGGSITGLNAGNVSAGTLATGRGGTGVTAFGGTNTILYTTAASALSSIATANSSVLVTSGTGVPSFSTTLPTIGKVTVASADGTAFQGSFTRAGQFNKCFNAHCAGMLNGDYAQFSWGRSLAPNESAEINFVYDSGGNSQVAFGIYGQPGIFTMFNDGTSSVGGALKLAVYAVASLPAGTAGRIVFASNGRKNGEGAGAGTGVLVYADGSAWRRVSDDTTVLA